MTYLLTLVLATVQGLAASLVTLQLGCLSTLDDLGGSSAAALRVH